MKEEQGLSADDYNSSWKSYNNIVPSVLGDTNKDGIPDYVVLNSDTSQIRIIQLDSSNNQTGFEDIEPSTLNSKFRINLSSYRLVSANHLPDLNGNGYDELAVGGDGVVDALWYDIPNEFLKV